MSFVTVNDLPAAVAEGLAAGTLAPYLGPGLLALCQGTTPPADPLALAAVLSSKSSVPGKIKNRVTAVAQFIENFKHRKSVVQLMDEAFAQAPEPSALHRALAASAAQLWVDTWYDDTFPRALSQARPAGGWLQSQGLSQSEHFGQWTGTYAADGSPHDGPLPAGAALLYKPLGGHAPASNYLVSDSDYVEVLTEIDIQTPIPAEVQARRSGRHFLFLGCRFDDQLTRSFARQIMKRSSDHHWAVLAGEPTRMEARFLEEQGITRIPLPLADFASALVDALQPALAA